MYKFLQFEEVGEDGRHLLDEVLSLVKQRIFYLDKWPVGRFSIFEILCPLGGPIKKLQERKMFAIVLETRLSTFEDTYIKITNKM